jgi:hypothetical protein
MQPPYQKPVVNRPEFTEENMPTYDYRNMEKAGKFRGVGERGKTGYFEGKESIEIMPGKSQNHPVRRDHRG